jgi:HSP20 family protein
MVWPQHILPDNYSLTNLNCMKLPIVRKQTEPEKTLSSFDRDMMPLREAMNRMFEESFWSPFAFSRWRFPSLDVESWMPRADISETDKEVQIKMNVPNVDANKITVSLEDGTLIVSGKTEEERKEEGKTYYRLERERGEFSRSFTLPDNIDAENVRAEAENGTLVITMPKNGKETKKQEIEVKVK